MFKIIFAVALSLTAFNSYAQETLPKTLKCSCEQDFQDFMGNVSHVTVHVTCPQYSEKSELSCDSEITNSTFSAACTNSITEQQNTTSIKLDPMDEPMYGYTYCRLN